MTPGQQLRAARTAVDLSLGDMARRLPWSKAALGFYETDQRTVPSEVIVAYTEVVNQERRRLAEEDDMRRRALLSLGAAAVPGLIAGAPILPDNGLKNLGETELDQLEALATHYRDWNERTGGGLQLRAVLVQIDQLAELAAADRNRVRRIRTFKVMARFSQTAATMFWDTGNDGKARRCYELALHASVEAHDRSGEVKALVGMGRQQLILGNPGEAQEFTRRALERAADRVPAALLAKVYTRHAWSKSSLRDINDFRRSTGLAAETLADANDDGGSSFDLAEFAGTTGARLLEMAHEDRSLAAEAATSIETAIALRDPRKLRSLALDQLGLAQARMLQGELEESCKQGNRAVETATKTGSSHVRTKLQNLLDLSATHNQESCVAELRDHISTVLAA
ncbi:helix-turn-helix transcriptional regulator [Glycomyces sp. MUSA5-2]|uniref:helix-turn-helix transcriptional regulator n=1 Tax=Glycomyces sp. MUSA5-2 TaxID=2053002 RepID=UPI0030084209